jgi:DNA-binding CsgD family transcriptional regulator
MTDTIRIRLGRERAKRAIALYRDGRTPAEISEILGVTVSMVHLYVKAARMKCHTVFLTCEEKAQIREWYSQGLGPAAIVRILQRDQATIWHHTKNLPDPCVPEPDRPKEELPRACNGRRLNRVELLCRERSTAVARAFRHGESVKSLAKRFNVSTWAIYRDLERADIPKNLKGSWRYTKEDRQRMRDLRKEGHTLAAIGRMSGCSPEAVRHHLAKDS